MGKISKKSPEKPKPFYYYDYQACKKYLIAEGLATTVEFNDFRNQLVATGDVSNGCLINIDSSSNYKSKISDILLEEFGQDDMVSILFWW